MSLLPPLARPPAAKKSQGLNPGILFALHYHNLFDYPLKVNELGKWEAGVALGKESSTERIVTFKNGYFFLDARKELVAKRQFQEELARKKRKIAQRGARVLAKIPFVKMVGITGSLAMQATRADDDIDLMVVTAKNTLWLTRITSYFLLAYFGFKVRHFGDPDAKDRLCLNIWLDETALPWDKAQRNVYTAHEIAQIVPLVNKNQTYEQFLWQNRWLLKYWPRAIKIQIPKSKVQTRNSKFKIWDLVLGAGNFFAFRLQYLYMKEKITREQVDKHKALFHPHNWSEVLLPRMDLTK
jgi:D-beta-D-heptose 7-phosphate kinase/D-beta-D-heptose 1-phosphate adenosyltransferase